MIQMKKNQALLEVESSKTKINASKQKEKIIKTNYNLHKIKK